LGRTCAVSGLLLLPLLGRWWQRGALRGAAAILPSQQRRIIRRVEPISRVVIVALKEFQERLALCLPLGSLITAVKACGG
jgi:hypothetical protein